MIDQKKGDSLGGGSFFNTAINRLKRKFASQPNENLFLASYEQLIIDQIGGLGFGHCKSGKDRKGLELMHTDAMIIYYHKYNTLPTSHDDENFVDIFVEHFKSKHQHKLAEYNAPGSYGIVNLKDTLPTSIYKALKKEILINQKNAKLNKPKFKKLKDFLTDVSFKWPFKKTKRDKYKERYQNLIDNLDEKIVSHIPVNRESSSSILEKIGVRKTSLSEQNDFLFALKNDVENLSSSNNENSQFLQRAMKDTILMYEYMTKKDPSFKIRTFDDYQQRINFYIDDVKEYSSILELQMNDIIEQLDGIDDDNLKLTLTNDLDDLKNEIDKAKKLVEQSPTIIDNIKDINTKILELKDSINYKQIIDNIDKLNDATQLKQLEKFRQEIEVQFRKYLENKDTDKIFKPEEDFLKELADLQYKIDVNIGYTF
ncbi:MAG: hypothetical protein HRT87_07250 [Legionellales bacterium]|nr:hypothetical protein [Legionellales bacterium]